MPQPVIHLFMTACVFITKFMGQANLCWCVRDAWQSKSDT